MDSVTFSAEVMTKKKGSRLNKIGVLSFYDTSLSFVIQIFFCFGDVGRFYYKD